MKDLSVVILARGRPELLHGCLHALLGELRGLESEVIVVEHQTENNKEWLVKHGIWAEAGDKPDTKVRYFRRVDGDQPESFSSLNNFGVAQTTGKAILLLNNDTIMRRGSLQPMLKVLEDKGDVGIVGAKLLFPNRTIQHIGVKVNRYGVPEHIGFGRRDSVDFAPAQRSDYYDCVTFACALIRREVWEACAGLAEEFHFNYEDSDFCLRAMEKGWRSYVEVASIVTHLEGQSAEHRQTFAHSLQRNLAVLEKRWIATGRLAKLMGPGFIDAGRLDLPGPRQLTKIAVLPASREAGVSWWRLSLPARKIIHKRLANVQVIFGDSPTDRILKVMENCDLAVWQSHYNEPLHRMAAMRDWRAHRMIYEIDDHPIYLSPYCQAYRGLGTNEVKIRATDNVEEWLWRDGQDGFDVERNRANLQRQLEIISLVDGISTSTGPLREYLSTLNHRVYELPNCIDFDFYPPVWERYERRPGPVRIGWWGGDNHWHDVSMVGKALTKYVNEHDVELVLIGSFYRGPFKDIDESKVREGMWVHCEAFPWRLATEAVDVVFVPLAPPSLPGMRFNHFKSDIKWLEASAYRLPCLVQAGVAAYGNCQDGENALTFSTDAEFLEKLDALCRDKELRARLGQGAYDWTRANRDLDKEIHRWVQAYEEVAALQATIQLPEVPESELRPAGSSAVKEGADAPVSA